MRKRSELKSKLPAEPRTPAEELAFKLQSGTTVFTVAIRSLMTDHYRLNASYGPASRFLAERLLNIPSVHAPLHSAALTFFSAKYAGKHFISTPELTQIFKPFDLAALFSALYLYRRLKKIVPPDEWGYISRLTSEQTEIGGHFGAAIPDIGIASAIICGGIRSIAFASFSIKDPKKFKEYRRHLRTHPAQYDREYERNAWQCDHLDITTLLLQRLGFGIELARSFYDAASDAKFNDEEVSGQFSRFHACVDSLEALFKSETPSKDDFGDGSLDEKVISSLLQEVRAIRKGGSQFAWLDKGKADYVAEDGTAPHSQTATQTHLDDIDTIDEISLDEVPEEIKQQLEQQTEQN